MNVSVKYYLRTIAVIVLICVLLPLGACKSLQEVADDDGTKYREAEDAQRAAFQSTTIALEGMLLNETGLPVAGARVQAGDQSVTSDSQGKFYFSGLSRLNRLLSITAAGYREELLPVYLNRPVFESEVRMLPVYLAPAAADEARMLFAGDTSFARRFLDPTDLTLRNQVPADHPDALIQASDPLPGSKGVLQFVRPYFQEADFSSINFETPVLVDPSKPHWDKDYAYFTLPASLPALTWLGVDYVCLGNNHVYDYLGFGLRSTLNYLDAAGIPYSGAAMNSEDAFRAYRKGVKGHNYAFLGATSISGRKHPISYVATETKGGAADLTLTQDVKDAIQREWTAGYTPIIQLHGGDEYSFWPTEYIFQRMKLVSRNGAALVLSHHPHAAQGVGYLEGVVNIYGLGNFAFDQDRLETFFGLLARVDMKGDTVHRVRLLPIYLEDYRPRPVSDRLAALMLRRVGEFSGDNVLLYPYNSQGWVAWGNYTGSVAEATRKIDVDITVPASGVTVVDLREYAATGESLRHVGGLPPGAVVRVGRDIMWYGDCEDFDTDEELFDMNRWDITNESVLSTVSRAYRGVSGISSIRAATHLGDSVIPFRQRIRVMGDELDLPNKDLSLFGYHQGEGAGAIAVVARFHASIEDLAFGEETVYTHPGGTFGWEAFWSDIHMPADDPSKLGDPAANPRAVRLFFRHSPPAAGCGIAAFDEIAVINWEEQIGNESLLKVPHARDFLKVQASPGTVRLRLTFISHQPR